MCGSGVMERPWNLEYESLLRKALWSYANPIASLSSFPKSYGSDWDRNNKEVLSNSHDTVCTINGFCPGKCAQIISYFE